MKINTLTPAQQELLLTIKDKWLNKLFGCNRRTDRAKATEGINWLYEFCGLQKPMIMYVDSPLACQYAYHFIKSNVKASTEQIGAQAADVGGQAGGQIMDQVSDQILNQVQAQVEAQVELEVENQVMHQVLHQVKDQVLSQLWVPVWEQIGNEVWDQISDQAWDQVRKHFGAQVRDQEFTYSYFAFYGGISNYYTLSFYDYFKTIGVLQHENFDKFSQLINSGIYDMIQLRNFCIVSELPIKISKNNQNRFHCEDGPAIEWADGYSKYYWNGVAVTKKLIETPHQITKEEILKESNAEVRRCIREKLGVEEYYTRLGGVILMDEDTDDQGNIMKLFRSREIDSVIRRHVQYLQVICPSTRREYILYPPNQTSKNVWEAKASTFHDEKIQYRHGDVGLLNVNKQFSKPIIES